MSCAVRGFEGAVLVDPLKHAPQTMAATTTHKAIQDFRAPQTMGASYRRPRRDRAWDRLRPLQTPKLLRQLAARRRIGSILRRIQCHIARRRGLPWGEVKYQPTDAVAPARPFIEIAGGAGGGAIDAWLDRQTVAPEITARPTPAPEPYWIFCPDPDDLPHAASWLESAWLVAATEVVDAVTLWEPGDLPDAPFPTSAEHTAEHPWRRRTLFSRRAWRLDRSTDSISPTKERVLVKIIGPTGVGSAPLVSYGDHSRQRGPYLASRPLPPRLVVKLQDPSSLAVPDQETAPSLLVTAPFFARGGAEQTLHSTLDILKQRFRIIFVSLAPHAPQLGDRRADFAKLSPHLFNLGDLVHPDAMPGIIRYLIRRHGVGVLYNANGTTLFYDFATDLKRREPGLRIVDHLYDHEVGYINWYADHALTHTVDACVAENHPVARQLIARYGWPEDRAPVVWPCGRAPEDLPPASEHETIRTRLRAELRIPADAFIVLTAARMHEQKRPLDLVRLAVRLADVRNLHLLVVGGGPLETAMDEAIGAAGPARITRLGFRPDIPELIVAADAGMLVSAFEGLPVFMLECLQLGRPFVGTEVGDVGKVLQQTGAGIICKPGDLEGLETALRLIIKPSEYETLCAAARTAGPRFSPQSCAARYAEVLFPDQDP